MEDARLSNLLLLCVLLVLPRALQRFRVPAPLTSLLLGVAGAQLLAAQFGGEHGPVQVLAVLGIASLFLHAGLEVDFVQLQRQAVPLAGFTLLRLAALGVAAWCAHRFLSLAWPAAVLLALALLTSSTGFILDSLDRFRLDEAERSTIANEAIVGELLALALMFVALQAEAEGGLLRSTVVLLLLVALLPLLYVALVRWVVPHAPGSEFSLLVMLAIAAAFVTHRLEVEHMLGAFIAGVVAIQLQVRGYAPLPASTMHAVKLFSSFFLPFFFFYNGMQVPVQALGLDAAGVGLALCLLIPIRYGATWARRRLARDGGGASLRIGVSLLPTLIFTLVLAQILHKHFHIPDALYGGLLIYAFVNTLLPSLLLRVGVGGSEAA
jgi:Kef-type K+ transport system membrane component KefB